MAHPKRRQSKTRTLKRRTHDKAVAPTLAVCPNCGAYYVYHTVCPTCGYYRGKLAIVVDEVLARYYIKLRGAEQYKVLGEDFGSEEYGIGVRKADTEFLAEIDGELTAMINDGTFAEIKGRWFSE